MLERTGWAGDQGSGAKDYRIVEGSFRVSPMMGRLPLLLTEKMKGVASFCPGQHRTGGASGPPPNPCPAGSVPAPRHLAALWSAIASWLRGEKATVNPDARQRGPQGPDADSQVQLGPGAAGAWSHLGVSWRLRRGTFMFVCKRDSLLLPQPCKCWGDRHVS